MRLNTLFLVSSVLLIVSCARTHSLDIDVRSEIKIHYVNNEEIHDVGLEPGSDDYKNISNWLEANRTGWGAYLVTPPVGRVYVSGTDFFLSFGEDWVIARAPWKGVLSSGTHLVKKIDPSALPGVIAVGLAHNQTLQQTGER